ncbi:hypothetical protein, partial [Phascolarctobacterium succinatutens]|uniref:hypothetical protein n=1 Tax=Phascolarctobacterium succinatutens TaxID=626940 RepID=UPI00307A2C70
SKHALSELFILFQLSKMGICKEKSVTKRKNRQIRFICVFPRKFAAKIAFFIGTLCVQVHFS